MITHVDFVVHFENHSINTCLQGLDTSQWVVYSLLQGLDAEFIVSKSVVLLDVALFDRVHALQ